MKMISGYRSYVVIMAGLAVWALCIAGCGSSEEDAGAAATGVVTVGGEPVTGGSIEFYPKGTGDSAFASIESDGTFEVATAAGVVGIAPGEYKVVITPPEEDDESSEGEAAASGPAIPKKYTSEKSTDLTATITAEGPNELKFEL